MWTNIILKMCFENSHCNLISMCFWLLLRSSVVASLPPIHWEIPSFSSIKRPPLLQSPSSPPVLHNSYLYNKCDNIHFICLCFSRSQNIQRAQHWTAPVPMPSLRPPSEWLARRSRSQTVSSTQASFRSSALKPSYTIV